MALLVGSVLVDTLLSHGRLDELTNMRIPNPNGPEIRAYVARPSAPGPHPTVIMIHEFWGLKPEILGKADALAQEGYIVVAPDLFRGITTSWIPRAIFNVISNPPAQVDGDLDAVYRWAASQPDVQADRIALMGFCFGGGTSIRYAVTNPSVAATVVFYGTPVTDPERLKGLGGPVLGIFGGADASIPIGIVNAFQDGLKAAGVLHQITVYDSQPHAFVEAIRRGGAPGQAWDEFVYFLEQTLKRASNGSSLPGYVRRIALDCVVPGKPEDALHVVNHLHAWLPNR
ncbi:MAG: dienelactone hydrolase family protein [Chloroflexi bacterium]|jgi:carboxymethylenebutenolidase|nr:MAG: dienelactone hydrolase family protein [Chloroflexota bacterium]